MVFGRGEDSFVSMYDVLRKCHFSGRVDGGGGGTETLTVSVTTIKTMEGGRSADRGDFQSPVGGGSSSVMGICRAETKRPRY